MNETKAVTKIGLETALLVVNAFLAIVFSASRHIAAHSGYVKTNLRQLAEVGFWIGLIALVVMVLARWKIKDFSVRCMFLVAVTMWNQACLLAFAVSLVPFRL